MTDVTIIGAIATLATALGIPAFIRARAEAAKKRAEGEAAAALKREEARLKAAEAALAEAQARKAHEETTGRFIADGYRDARADLSRCEEMTEELRGQLSALAERCDERDRACADRVTSLSVRVAELERQSVRPGGGR